jgi:hypothetical protein
MKTRAASSTGTPGRSEFGKICGRRGERESGFGKPQERRATDR